MLVTEDGEVDFGAQVSTQINEKEFPTNILMYAATEFRRATRLLAKRTIKNVVLKNVLSGHYHGIRSLSNSEDKCINRLLPNIVRKGRLVRLLTQFSAVQTIWMEQEKWMKKTTNEEDLTEKVNNPLSKLVPYEDDA